MLLLRRRPFLLDLRRVVQAYDPELGGRGLLFDDLPIDDEPDDHLPGARAALLHHGRHRVEGQGSRPDLHVVLGGDDAE